MGNILNDEKKQQVLALGRLGWPLRRIESATGVRRETASGYLKAAGIALRPPGGGGRNPPAVAGQAEPGMEAPRRGDSDRRSSLSKPANGVTTDFGAEPGREAVPGRADTRTSSSVCEPFREAIESALSRGRNAMAIWQDLVDRHGFQGGYQSVKRFVRQLRGTRTPEEACGIIATGPGEEAQVDYGTGPMVRDPETGRYRRTRLFVMTLGHSRKSVRLLVFRSSTRVWAELHEKAFRRLGGSTRVVVLDNLREGVLGPDIHDPSVNPLYRDVLAHYGSVALPCRVRDPDRKGKVESGVGHAQKTPLKGERFESLEAAQARLDQWEERWADTRIHGTTKRQVSAMFAEERPVLLPLPLEPFRYYQYGQRVVHLDGCVEVGAAYYGAPPGWISKTVHVQWDEIHVRLLDPATGRLLREHLRQERGGHRINRDEHPKQTPPTTARMLWRAEQAGPHVGDLCHAIHREQGEPAVRRILGVLSMVKKHGAAAVEDACAAALELGVAEYHFVRRYLERAPQLRLGLLQVDPLIRQLEEYRNFINERTKGMEDEPD